MPRLNYYTTSEVHLSLEDYHNAGLTPEETKACIEKLRDPGSCRGARLWCTPSGINHNWTVHTLEKMPARIALLLVPAIESALNKLLKEKTNV